MRSGATKVRPSALRRVREPSRPVRRLVRGQLGIVVFSARYKRDIHDMGEAGSRLNEVAPCDFPLQERSRSHSVVWLGIRGGRACLSRAGEPRPGPQGLERKLFDAYFDAAQRVAEADHRYSARQPAAAGRRCGLRSSRSGSLPLRTILTWRLENSREN